jgi:putative PIN family toxin of toxin-antitoxin system
MRVVVDTNTLASGALAIDGSPATAVVDAWREAIFTLVVSDDIMTELTRTLAKPYFTKHLPPTDITAFLDLVNNNGVPVDVPGTITGIATHPEDDRILESAVVAGSVYLVTGDKKLQKLTEFKGVIIVSPRQFADLLPRLRKGGGDV